MNNLADFVRNRGIKDSTEDDDIYLSKYKNLANVEDTLATDTNIKNETNEQIDASTTNSSNISKRI